MPGLNDLARDYYQDHGSAGGEGRMNLFQQEVLKTYGDKVSVAKRSKTLIKFGQNLDLDTGGIETVWSYGGNETYVDDNLIDTISSDDSADVGEVIRVEGHTISGSGADAEFTFVIQFATINGQNKVTLDTPLARCSRIFNTSGTPLVGGLYVYEDTAISGGVPSDTSKVHCGSPAGSQKSFKCATAFSNTDYFACTQFQAGVSRNSGSSSVDFTLEVRQAGKIFTPQQQLTARNTGSSVVLDFDPVLIIPKNADVRVRAEATNSNTFVQASFSGYLAEVVG